jgi:hypothetical protein
MAARHPVGHQLVNTHICNANYENAYREMLKNTKYLRVMLYNVPVKFDQAGNITKVAKYEYLFDVVKK